MTDKLVNYLSKNVAEFKYLLSDQSITRDAMVPDMFQYHKLDQFNPEKSTKNKYQLWSTPNKIYKDFNHIFCNCYSFYKNFVCKHSVKLVNLFGLSLKGYTKTEELLLMQREDQKRVF